jgi:hypothetical protein
MARRPMWLIRRVRASPVKYFPAGTKWQRHTVAENTLIARARPTTTR